MVYQIYKFVRLFFFFIFIVISIYACKFYQGSTLIYLLYCFFLIIMVFYLTDKKSSYFEIFLSCYIFLGFWFKYIFSLILYDGHVYESVTFSAKQIDAVLLIGIIICIVSMSASFVSKKIFHNLNNKLFCISRKSFFEVLYLNYRKLILFFFIITIIAAALLNVKYGFYQRGFIYFTDFSIIFINLIKWLMLVGFTTFSCFFIYIEILNLKRINFFTVLISLVEIFFSYTSMLSRSFVINSISLILPIYQKSLFLKKKNNTNFLFLFLIIVFLTGISVYNVNKIRLVKQDKVSQIINKKNSKIIEKINNENYIAKNTLNELQIKPLKKNTSSNDVTRFILVNRWIGIDSLLVVHYSKINNFDLFFKALEEKKTTTEGTFYENTFDKIKIQKAITKNVIVKGNTLPGFITFLYYSGNLFFVSILLFIIIIFFNYFEYFVKKISLGNKIFACFLSNLIATRLIHFGYAPRDSYLFILSIILALLLMYILTRFQSDFFEKK